MAQKYNENAAQSSLLPFNTTLFDQVVFTDISCWPWLNKKIENFKIAAENSILRQDSSRPNISEFLVYKNKLRILVLAKVYQLRRFFIQIAVDFMSEFQKWFELRRFQGEPVPFYRKQTLNRYGNHKLPYELAHYRIHGGLQQ